MPCARISSTIKAVVSSAKSDPLAFTRKEMGHTSAQDLSMGWSQIVVHAEPKMHGTGGPHCTAGELLRPLSRHASRSPYWPATLEARTAMCAVAASAGASFRAASCTLALAWKALNVGSCYEGGRAVAERQGYCAGVSAGIPHHTQPCGDRASARRHTHRPKALVKC